MSVYPTSNQLSSTSSLSSHHHHHHLFPPNGTSNENGFLTDFSSIPSHPSNEFGFPSNGNYFDVSIPSSASSHPHADPLVRHFFNYRQNESNNSTGNYYSNFDYSTTENYSSYPSSHPIGPAPSVSTTLPAGQQQPQNIYPWMRRIHHGCGKNFV